MQDSLLLIGRLLIAAVFLMTVWFGSPTAAYLKFLGYAVPDLWSVVARVAEWLIAISLVLGVATRYGAIMGILFVLVATVSAHQYWHYLDAAQQLVQYTFLTKNLAILGGLITLFVAGPGRFAVDKAIAGKP
jgi:putative oxidoreductase